MHPSLSARLRFEPHDIEAGLSRRPVLAFDAIVCRNVLIYIDRPVAVAIVARLATYLRPGATCCSAPPSGPGLAVGTAVRRPGLQRLGAAARAPALGDSDAGLPAVSTRSSNRQPRLSVPGRRRGTTVTELSVAGVVA